MICVDSSNSLTTKKNDDMIGQDKIKEKERDIAGWKAAGYNCTLPDPIGQFIEYYGFVCIINFVPVVNFVTILFSGGYLLWNKIKNVKL